MMLPFRIGHGYDIHRLVLGRKLILGGVHIPCERGLDGHSDADCLTHALADAILGALALPDIGHYFPNNDPQCRGMDSQAILAKAIKEAEHMGYRIGNVDISIIAEVPKLGPYLGTMREILADTLGISGGSIGLKATTNEGQDSIGQGLSIATHAVVLLFLN
jgi:2-C-methyl-D-erythritol 2,4-cyclodiphosphate synthase